MDPNIRRTRDLVASDDVVGTNVYDARGEHIGEVERLILEKRSGRVSYAVLSLGGFLGMGEDYYPLPWEKLTYDESLGGFRVDISKEQVEGVPRYSRDEDYDWSTENGRAINDYYGFRTV
ncbi:PRC-barrel domain-containing protein [Pseudaminobacter sp. NGMCC 1.201702]|uniref:PRC-barrel domain-containing protein n=1 Tax=Pseudaminobacter sp. NGMCC 1.201702 TaxID=3391825 RepID=UPI0039EE68EB